jgi:hypothetical protein
MVGVNDANEPSDAAKLFIPLMLKAGLKFREIIYGEPGPPISPDFDLFIGEKE